MTENRPRVGCGVLVWQDDTRRKMLLGHGHSSQEADVYATPGGHWENGESFAECARREAEEEAGIEIRDVKFIGASEFYNEAKQRYYACMNFEAVWLSGEPVPEEGKRLKWEWVTIEQALSYSGLFGADRMMLENYRDGLTYREPETIMGEAA